MKVKALKQLTNLVLTFLYIVSFLIGLPAVAQAATINRPYFKVYGGDVFAGGAFIQSSTCDRSLSNGYHAPTSLSPLTNPYNGGIIGYIHTGAGLAAGSSTNLAGYALGAIKGQAPSPNPDLYYGFYTGANLAFASPPGYGDATSMGGLWEGTTPQAHCIPDYYSKQSGAQGIVSIPSFSGMNGQYALTTNGNIVVPGGTVNANQRLTIFVSGNVWISDNIQYTSRANYDASSIPKFALVVKGNIYISESVTQLDGVYIAQPTTNTTANSGVIWTCHDNSASTSIDPTYVRDKCKKQLVVNGAFVAAQVNLLRSNGNVGSASAGEAANGNVAEVFNYTPEMILGGPFFNPTSTNSNQIESLISLPPVF